MSGFFQSDPPRTCRCGRPCDTLVGLMCRPCFDYWLDVEDSER